MTGTLGAADLPAPIGGRRFEDYAGPKGLLHSLAPTRLPQADPFAGPDHAALNCLT